jgi:hypothetical protein
MMKSEKENEPGEVVQPDLLLLELVALRAIAQWEGQEAAPRRMHEIWQRLGKLVENYEVVEAEHTPRPQSDVVRRGILLEAISANCVNCRNGVPVVRHNDQDWHTRGEGSDKLGVPCHSESIRGLLVGEAEHTPLPGKVYDTCLVCDKPTKWALCDECYAKAREHTPRPLEKAARQIARIHRDLDDEAFVAETLSILSYELGEAEHTPRPTRTIELLRALLAEEDAPHRMLVEWGRKHSVHVGFARAHYNDRMKRAIKAEIGFLEKERQ